MHKEQIIIYKTYWIFVDLVKKNLTPKRLNCVFWQHSDLGQLTTNGVFIFFL